MFDVNINRVYFIGNNYHDRHKSVGFKFDTMITIILIADDFHNNVLVDVLLLIDVWVIDSMIYVI